MAILESISDVINTFGTDVSISNPIDDTIITFKAFIQHFHYQNKLFIEQGFSDVGRVNSGYYNYFGPAVNGGELVVEGAILVTEGQEYWVKKSEKYLLKNVPTYIWAVLQPVIKNVGIMEIVESEV